MLAPWDSNAVQMLIELSHMSSSLALVVGRP